MEMLAGGCATFAPAAPAQQQQQQPPSQHQQQLQEGALTAPPPAQPLPVGTSFQLLPVQLQLLELHEMQKLTQLQQMQQLKRQQVLPYKQLEARADNAAQPVHSQQQHQKHHGARTLQATAYNASAAANAASNKPATSPPDNTTMHHCKRNHDSMGKQDSVVESKRPRSVSQLVQVCSTQLCAGPLRAAHSEAASAAGAACYTPTPGMHE
jgi:hypothetical protein